MPGSRVVRNPAQWGRLEDYVSGIIAAFRSDERVVVWDMYNEPGNNYLLTLSLPTVLSYATLIRKLGKYLLLPCPSSPLLEQTFAWARAAQPSQPLTGSLWYLRASLQAQSNVVALAQSDVITFHSYFDLDVTTRLTQRLEGHGRPLLCNEYLSRNAGSLLETHLPYLQQEKIGAYNWGLVDGKTQTKYGCEGKGGTEKPEVWFHDVLRQDGTPSSPAEAELLRKLAQ